MVISDLLYTETVEDEEKDNGTSFVAPKARGGGGLLVTC